MRETKAMLRAEHDRLAKLAERLQGANNEMREALGMEIKARMDAEARLRDARREAVQQGQKWQAAQARMEGLIRHLTGIIGDPNSMVTVDPINPINRAPEGYAIVTDGASKQDVSPFRQFQGVVTDMPSNLAARTMTRTPLKDMP